MIEKRAVRNWGQQSRLPGRLVDNGGWGPISRAHNLHNVSSARVRAPATTFIGFFYLWLSVHNPAASVTLSLSLSLSLSLLSFHLLSIVCSVHMFLCLCQSTIRSKRYDRLNSYLCLGICEYLGIGLNTSWSFPFCKPFLSIFQHPILLLNLFIFTVRVCLPRWYFVPCCFSQETFSSCLSTVPISLYALSCQTLCLSFHT